MINGGKRMLHSGEAFDLSNGIANAASTPPYKEKHELRRH